MAYFNDRGMFGISELDMLNQQREESKARQDMFLKAMMEANRNANPAQALVIGQGFSGGISDLMGNDPYRNMRQELGNQRQGYQQMMSGVDFQNPQSMRNAAKKFADAGHLDIAEKLLKRADDADPSAKGSSNFGKSGQRWVDSEGNYFGVQYGEDGTVKKTPMNPNVPEPIGQLSPVDVAGDTGALNQWQAVALKYLSSDLGQRDKGFEALIQRTNDRMDEAKDVKETLDTLNEQIRLVQSGKMATGAFANIESAFDNIAAEFGITSGDIAANTDVYKANGGKLVGKVIKQFGSGTGLSDKDREFAEKMVAANPNLQKLGLLGILTAMKAASERHLGNYNKFIRNRTPDFIEKFGMGKDELYIGDYGLPQEDQYDQRFNDVWGND